MDYMFNRFKEIKSYVSSSNTKRIGILDFQMRILELIRDDLPIIDQIRYVDIVADNIKNFMIERVPEIRSYKEFDLTIKYIQRIMQSISDLLENRANKYKITDIDRFPKSPVIDYLYLTMQQSCYFEETDIEKIKEQMEVLKEENKPCIGLTDYASIANSYMGHNVVYWFVCPRSFLLVKEYVRAFDDRFKCISNTDFSPSKLLPEKSFIDDLDHGREFVIRCPYNSYITVEKFIQEMCTDENIKNVWITLYRVNPNHSKIVEYLKSAAKKGKNVFVFVELNARGDEINNYRTCEELKNAGCNVRTDYFGYKVHGKLFLAMHKDGNLYGHIGTGNYNEKTAMGYTDIHYITGNKEKTSEMLNILIALFEKKVYRTNLEDPKVISSPMNIRPFIINFILNETHKGKDGRIYIKVNNFCDEEITTLLYDAADSGVDVKLICRTACTLKPRNNLKVRSKAGKYLEHDRIYVFGDRYFIGSADLLFRNISKRFEIMCEIEDSSIYAYFMRVWEDKPIYNMTGYRKWRLLNY